MVTRNNNISNDSITQKNNKSQAKPPNFGISEDNKGVFLFDDDVRIYLTDFVFKVHAEYRNLDDNTSTYFEVTLCSCRIEGYKIERIFRGSDFDDLKAFKSAVNDMYCTCDCRKIGYLNALKRYIFDGNYPIKNTVSFGGLRLISNQWYYIEAEQCLLNGLVSNDYIIDKTIPSIKSDVLSGECLSVNDALVLSYHIFSFNDEKITYNLLGYLASTFFKSKLKALGLNFPHLMIVGEAGSGKSQTLKNVLYPLLGITQSYNANSTTRYSFDNLLSSNCSIPLVLDEYKPYMMLKYKVDMISDIMRTSYDDLAAARGTKDMTIKELSALTNLVLCGEAGTDETAVLERSIILNFSKRESYKKYRTEAFNFIREHPKMLRNLAFSLVKYASAMDLDTLLERFESNISSIPASVKDYRVRQNLACVRFGLQTLSEVAGFHFDFQQVTSILVSNSVDIIGESSKSLIDLTFEELDKALPVIEYNMLDKYRAIQSVDNGNELAINLRVIYPLFCKYLKDYNIDFAPLKQTEFQRQLKLKDYYLGYKTSRFKSFNNPSDVVYRKAFSIDANYLRSMELENFFKE